MRPILIDIGPELRVSEILSNCGDDGSFGFKSYIALVFLTLVLRMDQDSG